MKPVLALVGRPNVGKSTLFNRLTKSRDAIVADFAGLTRDRHYGQGRLGKREFIVIDTGGFEPDASSGIYKEMAKQTQQAVAEADVVIVNDLVEKPKVEEAPSNLAVIGRYVLRPEMFTLLEQTKPGRGGEIQLTDALEAAALNPAIAGGVRGVVFTGNRYDTGDKVGFLKAAMILGSRREDIGPELSTWLKEYAKTL